MDQNNIATDIKNNINTLHERTQKTKTDLMTHEAICAERYVHLQETLERMNKAIDLNTQQISDLHKIATESRVSIKTIFIIGSIVLSVTGFIYTVINIVSKLG